MAPIREEIRTRREVPLQTDNPPKWIKFRLFIRLMRRISGRVRNVAIDVLSLLRLFSHLPFFARGTLAFSWSVPGDVMMTLI